MARRKKEDRIPIDSDYSPYKKKVFKNFILWNSIPYQLRKMRIDEAENLGINVKEGLLKELLSINTQKDFAEKYNVSQDILCIWNRRKDYAEELEKIISEGNLRFKKDVDFSFTQKTIKYGDAKRFKLWKEYFEGWTEKKKIEVEGSLGSLIDEISDKKENLVKSESVADTQSKQIESKIAIKEKE
jgi:hypothetical protein